MKTFVTGMAFMAVLTAALLWVMAFAGLDPADLGSLPSIVKAEPAESLARFEPSSPAVISEMLNIAGVSKNDVVYDLGSGDGRVVIAAARAGAQAVGVDIDRQLVRESRENAEKAKVSHLVQFLEEDLIKADLSRASVVMLYLSPAANLILKPRLLKDLKPGARIVSHSHDMGDWKPDRSVKVEEHPVYLWVVPAPVAGSWSLELMDKYSGSSSLEFTQAYQSISVRLKSGTKTIPVSNARLQGSAVAFTTDAAFGSLSAPAIFAGEVDGETIRGTFKSKAHSGAWSARKTK